MDKGVRLLELAVEIFPFLRVLDLDVHREAFRYELELVPEPFGQHAAVTFDLLDPVIDFIELAICLVESPVHPVESPVHPVESSVYPFESSVYPFEPSVYPFELSVYPLELSVYPLELLVYPLKPLIQPTNKPMKAFIEVLYELLIHAVLRREVEQ
jgi:hypothetical protein